MSVLLVLVYVLVVLISLLLIGLILIQPAKSGGMGAAFGGVGESVLGGKAGSHLTKATVWMTAVFFVLALLLAVLIGHGLDRDASGPGDSGLDAALANAASAQAEVPATPAAPATPATPAAPAAPATK